VFHHAAFTENEATFKLKRRQVQYIFLSCRVINTCADVYIRAGTKDSVAESVSIINPFAYRDGCETTSHRDYIGCDKVVVTRHRKRVEIVQLLDNRCSKSAWDFFDNSQIFISKCSNVRNFFPPLALQPSWALAAYHSSDLSQLVGLLGRVISPSQGRYLNTGQHKYRINTCTTH
jgi:hypothetical protein